MKKFYEKLMKERDMFKVMINSDFKQLMEETEKCIGIAFEIDYMLRIMHLNFFKKTNKKLSGPKSLIPLISNKNCYFLLSASNLIKDNLVNPSRAVLRTVYEGIQRNYAIYLDKNLAEKIYNEDILNQECRVKPWEIRKSLYSKKMLPKVEELYNNFCITTHPSIKGASAEYIYHKLIIKDVLNSIILLCFFNSTSLLKIHWNQFNKEEQEILLKLISSFKKECWNYSLTPDNFKVENIHKKLS